LPIVDPVNASIEIMNCSAACGLASIESSIGRKAGMQDGSVPQWHEVAAEAEIEVADAKRIRIGEKWIAVFNVNGTFYATSDICTHAHAHLSDGYIDGETVECPLHQGLFHIPSGKALAAPVTTDLRTYPVRVRCGTIEVQAATNESDPA
jgi:nitrite reductase/ring-hydroxylating ferredoxin subunit